MTPDEAKKLYSRGEVDFEKLREAMNLSLKHVTTASKRMQVTKPHVQLEAFWCNPEPGNYTVSSAAFTREITTYYGQMLTAKPLIPVQIVPDFDEPLEDELEPEPELGVAQYNSDHYSEYLFNDTKRIVGQYVNAVETGLIPEHDTLIGTGLSGSIAAGLLAYATDKMYMVLRKKGADHHSSNLIEGRIGAKWIFVDDFIGGGHTRRRVHNAVDDLAKNRGIRLTYVGSWLYLRAEYQKEC